MEMRAPIGLIVAGRFRNDIPMNLSFSLLAIGFVGNLLFLFSAQAQQPPPLNPPPLAQPVSVSVYSGRSVEIPLQASGRTPSQVRFIIRTKPRYGTLGEIRLTGRASAEVTYTRSDKDSLQPDSFRYAVQTVDSPVSAAADVLISVTEEAPRLRTLKPVDFGSVFIGDAVTQSITLKNEGGGTLVGKLESDEVFNLEPGSDLSVAKGQEKKVNLRFQPQREGIFSGTLSFNTSPRGGVSLSGTALSPLKIEPSTEISLSRDAPTSVTLHNVSPTARKLSFSTPPGVQALSSVELAPGASTEMELTVSPDHLEAIQGSLRIEFPGFVKEIPLTVFAAPPLLRAFPAGGLDFGSMAIGDKKTLSLRLANLGGSDARIQAELPFGVLTEPSLSASVLSPGEKRIYAISLEASQSGSVNRDLTIEAAGAPSLKIPLKAVVPPPLSVVSGAPSPSASALAALPEPTPAQPSPTPFFQLPPPPNPGDLPPINAIAIRKATAHEIEISWPVPEGKIARYLVESRRLVPDGDNPPRQVWSIWKDVAIRTEGKEVTATFRDLPTNVAWFIRISFVDTQGKTSTPSRTFRIGTPPKPRSSLLYWLGGFALLGIGVFAWKKIQAFREAAAREEADRLSRLD